LVGWLVVCWVGWLGHPLDTLHTRPPGQQKGDRVASYGEGWRKTEGIIFVGVSWFHTVDGSEIPFPSTVWDVLKARRKSWDKLYNHYNLSGQLVIAGVLNH